MNKRIIIIFAFIGILFVGGCKETKDTYLKDFQKFVEKVEANSANYTEADWQKADEKYKAFTGEEYDKYKNELSTPDLLKITKMKATYITLHGATYLKNSLDKALKDSNKALDQMIKDK